MKTIVLLLVAFTMFVKADALSIVKQFEGFKSTPYTDVNGAKKIGYGSPCGSRKSVTKAEANTLLASELKKVRKDIDSAVTAKLTANQKEALVSLVYNIGITRFRKSNLRKAINKGDQKKIEKEWKEWRLVNGKVSNGLVKRRAAELQLWKTK